MADLEGVPSPLSLDGLRGPEVVEGGRSPGLGARQVVGALLNFGSPILAGVISASCVSLLRDRGMMGSDITG